MSYLPPDPWIAFERDIEREKQRDTESERGIERETDRHGKKERKRKSR